MCGRVASDVCVCVLLIQFVCCLVIVGVVGNGVRGLGTLHG